MTKYYIKFGHMISTKKYPYQRALKKCKEYQKYGVDVQIVNEKNVKENKNANV